MFFAFRRSLLPFVIFACFLPAMARDPVQVALPDKPDEWYKASAEAGLEGKYEIIWQALPASYQADIKSLFAEFPKKMDPELWAEANKVVAKATKLFTEKADFIVGSQLVAPILQNNSIKAEDAKKILKATAGLVSQLQSSVATLPQVEKLDVEKLLADVGPNYLEFMKAIVHITKLPPGMSFDDIYKFDVKLIRSNMDSATLELSRGDSPKLTLELVRVEGKWVNKTMADQWSLRVGEARKVLNSLQLKPEDKQKALGYLSMASGMLDGFLNAKTQEEFDGAAMVLMPLIQQAMPKNLGGPVIIQQQKPQPLP